MRAVFDIILFAAGFATCWFCKEPVLGLVSGTDALIKSLEIKLAAPRAKS